MATGYTHPVKDGEVTDFAEFALQCSRAMGAAIMQRDEHPSVKLKTREPSEHYAERVREARATLDEYLSRTDKDWQDAAAENLQERIETWEQRKVDNKVTFDRYTAMLQKVRAWEPPTEEHEGLKKFMIEQLEDSIRWDVHDVGPEPVLEDWRDFREKTIEHQSSWYLKTLRQQQEDVERVASQNEWVEKLYESLGIEYES